MSFGAQQAQQSAWTEAVDSAGRYAGAFARAFRSRYHPPEWSSQPALGTDAALVAAGVPGGDTSLDTPADDPTLAVAAYLRARTAHLVLAAAQDPRTGELADVADRLQVPAAKMLGPERVEMVGIALEHSIVFEGSFTRSGSDMPDPAASEEVAHLLVASAQERSALAPSPEHSATEAADFLPVLADPGWEHVAGLVAEAAAHLRPLDPKQAADQLDTRWYQWALQEAFGLLLHDRSDAIRAYAAHAAAARVLPESRARVDAASVAFRLRTVLEITTTGSPVDVGVLLDSAVAAGIARAKASAANPPAGAQRTRRGPVGALAPTRVPRLLRHSDRAAALQRWKGRPALSP